MIISYAERELADREDVCGDFNVADIFIGCGFDGGKRPGAGAYERVRVEPTDCAADQGRVYSSA